MRCRGNAGGGADDGGKYGKYGKYSKYASSYETSYKASFDHHSAGTKKEKKAENK